MHNKAQGILKLPIRYNAYCATAKKVVIPQRKLRKGQKK